MTCGLLVQSRMIYSVDLWSSRYSSSNDTQAPLLLWLILIIWLVAHKIINSSKLFRQQHQRTVRRHKLTNSLILPSPNVTVPLARLCFEETLPSSFTNNMWVVLTASLSNSALCWDDMSLLRLLFCPADDPFRCGDFDIWPLMHSVTTQKPAFTFHINYQ